MGLIYFVQNQTYEFAFYQRLRVLKIEFIGANIAGNDARASLSDFVVQQFHGAYKVVAVADLISQTKESYCLSR